MKRVDNLREKSESEPKRTSIHAIQSSLQIRAKGEVPIYLSLFFTALPDIYFPINRCTNQQLDEQQQQQENADFYLQ